LNDTPVSQRVVRFVPPVVYPEPILYIPGDSDVTDQSPAEQGLTLVNGGNGAPSVSTTTKKVGAGSVYFPGPEANSQGAEIKINTPGNFSYDINESYTLMAWVYFAPDAVSNGQCLWGWNGDIINYTMCEASNGHIAGEMGDGNSFETTTDIRNAWHHIALIRYVANTPKVKLYVDGVQEASDASSGASTISDFRFGDFWADVARGWKGYMDEIVFVLGEAVYTGPFTPPTTAYVWA
jgi:hypothetical protein